MRVIFGYNSSFKSRVIRIRTLCKWSHVGIIIGDFVLEAQVLPLIGKPFDSLGAIGLFMNIPILKSNGAFICSGLVAIASNEIEDINAAKATPRSIYKLTSSLLSI